LKVVNKLHGKNVRREIKSVIDENGVTITNDISIANGLASYFKYKVDLLRKYHPPLKDVSDLMQSLRRNNIVDFIDEEISEAVKSTKPKMSAGPDGIPTKKSNIHILPSQVTRE